MKNLVTVLLLAAIAWFAYGRYNESRLAAQEAPVASDLAHAAPVRTAAASGGYTCDGREHCSQMRSCAEATYFIQHCPNTKMDGNNDGVPCEQQWCK